MKAFKKELTLATCKRPMFGAAPSRLITASNKFSVDCVD